MRLAVLDSAKFEESKHPRDDVGKFSTSPGGNSGPKPGDYVKSSSGRSFYIHKIQNGKAYPQFGRSLPVEELKVVRTKEDIEKARSETKAPPQSISTIPTPSKPTVPVQALSTQEVRSRNSQDDKAFLEYTGVNFTYANSVARGRKLGLGRRQQEIGDKLLSDLDKAWETIPPTKESETLYRGLSLAGQNFLNHQDLKGSIGKEFTDGGWVSTSSDQSVATGFASGSLRGKPDYRHGVVLKVNVPAGSRVLDVQKTIGPGKYGNEKEKVLPRGGSFKIEAVESDNRPRQPAVLRVSFVPNNGPVGANDYMPQLATDPPVSEAQRRAMYAAAAGKSNIGIPSSVGKEFTEADPGGKLPSKAKDMSKDMSKMDWGGLFRGLFKFFGEEAQEPEHSEDEEEKPKPEEKVDPEIMNRGAGVAFMTKDGKALFLKRSHASDHVGEWGFPGGTIEPGEGAEECAKRETMEETGKDCDCALKSLDSRVSDEGTHFSTYFHPADDEFKPNLKADEHSHYVWAPLDQPPQPLHPGVKATLDMLKEKSAETQDEKSSTVDIPLLTRLIEFAGEKAPDDEILRTAAEELTKISEEMGRPLAMADYKAVVNGLSKDSKWQGFSNQKAGGGSRFGLKIDKPGLLTNVNKQGNLIRKPLNKDEASPQEGQRAVAKAVPPQALASWIESRRAAKQRAAPAKDNTPMATAPNAGIPLGGRLSKMNPKYSKIKFSKNVLGSCDSLDYAMAFDRASVRSFDTDGRLHVETSHISKATINPYYGREIPNWRELGLDPNKKYNLLRDPEELRKGASTFNNLPVLSRHVPVSVDAHQPDLVIGSTGTDASFNGQHLDNSLVFWTKPAIDDIEADKVRELSCAYRYDADMTPGEYNGERYDGVMRNIKGNHVALVKEGRAGPDVVVGDSAR